MKNFWNFIMYFTNMSVRYDRIVSDPNRREKSVWFGVQSLVASLFGAAVIILCAFGISALMKEDNIVTLVFIILLVVIMLVAILECRVRGLISMMYQLRVNKKPVGWIALAIWIVALVLEIVISALMIGKVF